MEAIDKTELELQWTNHRCSGIPNWADYRSTHRIYVHEGSRLVYWTLRNGAPVILDTFSVQEVQISFKRGLDLGLVASNRTQDLVTPNPREMVPGVFLWTPAFADVRYAPVQFFDLTSPRRVTAPLCIKTRKNPKEGAVEGVRYFSTIKEFRAFWPDII